MRGDVDEPRRETGGEVIGPSSAAYDEARAVWNGMIDRRLAVVRAATTRPTSSA